MPISRLPLTLIRKVLHGNDPLVDQVSPTG
jgi:hypothetical protein